MCDAPNIGVFYLFLCNWFFGIGIEFGDTAVVSGDKNKLIRTVRVEDPVDAEWIFETEGLHWFWVCGEAGELDLTRAG